MREKSTTLSEDNVKRMLRKFNFFDSSWNKQGAGIIHLYDTQSRSGDPVVKDYATGLMWQQHGSEDYMKFEQAKTWIDNLNKQEYAGYKDWRMPTQEEGMSLMERKKKERGFIYRSCIR